MHSQLHVSMKYKQSKLMFRILIPVIQLDRYGYKGLVLTNNNYLALIATKSCKNNFCCFLSVIMVLTFNVNFKFFKLIMSLINVIF